MMLICGFCVLKSWQEYAKGVFIHPNIEMPLDKSLHNAIPDGTYIWKIDRNARNSIYLQPSDLKR